ncbi:MAG: hypothetical protein AABY18_08915 [Candidatus Thermoplasmatota archaeon]
MRRGTRLEAWAFALLILLAPTTAAKGIEVQRGPALDFLASRLDGTGTLAANIAEAAHANGLDPSTWPSALDPVANHIPPTVSADASNVSLLRPLRALAFAHHPAAAPDGDLTLRVLAKVGPDGFGDPQSLNDDAYAILALRAVGLGADDLRLQAARSHLLATQGTDGGWGWAIGAPSGTDLTGLTVEALAVSGGVPEDVAAGALTFLASTRGDSGFAETPGGTPNCESTVWGLRATDHLGTTPRATDWRFLLGLQLRDGGFSHLPGGLSDLLCTTEAATLLGEAHAGIVAGPALDGRGIPAPGGLAVIAVAVAAALRIRRP